ncbi:MAG: hypothetical protein WDN25_03965 [Acetobacteraceae bacterium]
MAAEGQNFTLVAGDTVRLAFTAYDSDGTTPLDLAGATIKWQLARDEAGPALISKQTGSGITVTNAAGGTFVVAIAPADTAAITAGGYYHETQVTDASGNVSTVATGSIAIIPGLIA